MNNGSLQQLLCEQNRLVKIKTSPGSPAIIVCSFNDFLKAM